ncbi:MAG: DUF2808 domain-containing protein [Pseudanabaena sp. ELA607]|jgi:hypothetical protein
MRQSLIRYGLMAVTAVLGLSAPILGIGNIIAPAAAQNNVILFGPNGSNTFPYTIRSARVRQLNNSANLYATLRQGRAVSEIHINYTSGLGGLFNPDNMAVRFRASGNPIAVSSFTYSPELNSLRIAFKDPIQLPTNKEIEIYSTGWSNPASRGMYAVDVFTIGTEANPQMKFIGQWLIDIN